MFGLAQLYQIRGRVGRSRERAYAYLLYPSHAALTEEATKRLSALSDYTELGAGFRIAMRDLEIRGAGNLLGDEQSGHVAALGFELYLQMLDEAIRELRSPTSPARRISSRCASTSTSTPTSRPTTSPTSRPRSTSTAGSPARARSPTSACCARSSRTASGPMPEPLANLIALQQARIKLGQAGARVVSFRGTTLAVTPIELDSERAAALREALPAATYEPGRSQLSVRVPEDPQRALPRRGRRRGRAVGSDANRGMSGLHCRLHAEARRTYLNFVRLFLRWSSVVSGCGGSVPSDSVAKVGDTSITKDDFNHRLLVTYLSSQTQTNPTGKPNAKAMPAPPDYKGCIAAAKKAAPKPAKGQPQSPTPRTRSSARRPTSSSTTACCRR